MRWPNQHLLYVLHTYVESFLGSGELAPDLGQNCSAPPPHVGDSKLPGSCLEAARGGRMACLRRLPLLLANNTSTGTRTRVPQQFQGHYSLPKGCCPMHINDCSTCLRLLTVHSAQDRLANRRSMDSMPITYQIMARGIRNPRAKIIPSRNLRQTLHMTLYMY